MNEQQRLKASNLCSIIFFLYHHLIIAEAIQEYFYGGDGQKMQAFWENEGKIIRQNQRRGLLYRSRHP